MHVPWITIDTPDVCNGTVPLSIVVYIEGSFIKNRIAAKPIYITVQSKICSVITDRLRSATPFAWRVLGMLPALNLFEEESHCDLVECLASPSRAQNQIASCMHETCSRFSGQVLFC